MKRSHLKLYSIILILCAFIPHDTPNATAQKKYTVKVLIGEHTNRSSNQTWKITSSTGFLLYNPAQKIDWHWLHQPTLTISHNRGQLLINGTPYKEATLRIIPKDGYAGIDNVQYHGSFSIAQEQSKTYLINHVDLEEYVYSVLKTESWPGWPIEVNKAFAISSRSYVVAMISQMSSNRPYHVKNTNEHQTYRGMHNTNSIRAALEQTKGMILMHNNEPALTMFDSCCGGIIPAHISDFDFQKAPYLARPYACTHCSQCRIYSWQKEVPLTEINKQIASLFDKPGMVHHIAIAQTDKAGLVTEVNIKQGNHSHTLSGKQLYSALKDIKSYCYSVERKSDKLILSGKGYGHHLGMCQWGAREMVRDGWHYKRILAFYYPGTELKKV